MSRGTEELATGIIISTFWVIRFMKNLRGIITLLIVLTEQ